MVRFTKITVFLLDGTAVAFTNNTLLEVAKTCLSHPLANRTPLLVKISEDYKLYFNNELFISWIKKEIDLEELLNHVKVDNLVRNLEDIIETNVSVEAGYLWLQKNNLCILADKDMFVSVALDNRFTCFN
jgi:hypothetical protein